MRKTVPPRWLLVLLPAGLILLLVYCSQYGRGAPVELVVPKGFTGGVWLVLDERDGPEIPFESGRYRVVVSANGVLRVRSLKPFHRWHQFSAAYDDGTPIPQEVEKGSVPSGVVAVRGGGAGVTTRRGRELRYVYYFVGTAAQYEKWQPADSHPPGIE